MYFLESNPIIYLNAMHLIYDDRVTFSHTIYTFSNFLYLMRCGCLALSPKRLMRSSS